MQAQEFACSGRAISFCASSACRPAASRRQLAEVSLLADDIEAVGTRTGVEASAGESFALPAPAFSLEVEIPDAEALLALPGSPAP